MHRPTRPADNVPAAGESALAYLAGPGDRRAIASACSRLGLTLAAVVREAVGDDARPELHRALDNVAGGRASCLVVRRLDDLGHGAGGLEPVLERVEADGIRLVALDVGLDTGRPVGRLALVRNPRRTLPRMAEADSEPEGVHGTTVSRTQGSSLR
jgi:hypothetical protein